MPARIAAGGFLISTVTAYDTTLPLVLPTAVGAIAVTVPSRSASTAATDTAAACPTETFERSLSTTSAVTWNDEASMTIASPDGAARPLVTLTVVMTPSIGALIVARWIWLIRSVL